MSGTRLDPAIGRVELSNRFLATLRTLVVDPRTHAEAIAILAFYRALHLVDAMFLSTKGAAPAMHGTRAERLGKDRRLHGLKRQYDPHFEAAYVARYLTLPDRVSTVPTFFDYRKPDKVVSDLVEGRLAELERLISKLVPPRLAKLFAVH